MIEDRELDSWRGQWASVANPSPDFQKKVRQKINRRNRHYIVGNVASAIVFAGLLIFAGYMRREASWMGSGWATGICVLVAVVVALRVWAMRGTWRAEVQSTRGFLELWKKRAQARIRLLRISMYVSFGWLVFCAVLTAVNWPTIGRDVKARPWDWIEVLVLCVVMQPVIWYWAGWLRRRKLAELAEVNNLLSEMKD